MKRFSKILAIVLTACILCGLIVTAAFANTEPAYTHPTLTNAAATNIINYNFEGDSVGDYAAHSLISTSRFANSSLRIAQSSVNGVPNNFWKVQLPTDELNTFLTGSNGTNQRSSYLQLRPNSDYKTPTWYLGNYAADLTNNFDYMTFDFDLSAQGARVEWSDGTYGRATEVTKGDDGSITVTLDDGTVVVTNAAKTETTMTKEGAVTVITTNGNTVTETATAADGSKVASVTVASEDGSAVKTVTTYGTDGAEVSKVTMTRSAVVDGGYTVTYGSGKTLAYAYSYVVNNSETGENTTTETYTVTDAGVVTVYTFIDHKSKKSSYEQTLTYRKTVGGEVEAENVSNFKYANGSGTHSNKAYIATFNAEFDALGEEFSKADLVGKHISATRAAYAETSMYNTLRYSNDAGDIKSVYNYFYIHYANGSWGIYQDGKTSEANRIVTLPDDIGVWNHITLVVEADNDNWFKSKIHFAYNGEILSTKELNTLVSGSQKFLGIEDWRMTVNEVLPQGDANYFAMGLDNISINAYAPTVSEGVRTPYSSGNAVGIDDFCAGGISLVECSDVIFNKDYQLPNNIDSEYYAIVDGEKYYIDYLALGAIKSNAKNGETVETTMDLLNIELPEGIKYINIKCAPDVECTAAPNLIIEKTADGYTVKRQYVYTDGYEYRDGTDISNFAGAGTNSTQTNNKSKLSVQKNGDNSYVRFAWGEGEITKRIRRDIAIGPYSSTNVTVGHKASRLSYYTVDFDINADQYVYVDGNGNQVLATEIPDGIDNYWLAYPNYLDFTLDSRVIDKADSTSYRGTGYNPITAQLRLVDGEWHVFVDSNDTGFVLSNNVGEWNHFTYAVKINHSNYAKSEVRLYLNGEVVATANLSSGTIYDITPRAIDLYFAGSSNLNDKFSVGLDNFVSNFYTKDYTSGDMAGIDDLFLDGKTTSTVDYQGLVYDAEYPFDPSVSGYVQIGEGEKIYNPVLAKRAVESAPAGSVITSTRDLYDVTPSGALTLISPNGSDFTLSAEGLEKYIAIKTESEGTVTYEVRLPSENDMITLKWVDVNGNVIATETLFPSIMADSSDKNGTLFDIETGKGSIVSGWYWDLDGDGSEYAEAPISSFGIEDIAKIGGTTVEVYPKMSEVTLPANPLYIAYVNDDGIIRLGDDNVEYFNDITKLQKTIDTCYDGAIIKIVAPIDNIVLPIDTFYSYSGKAITFDLNGKTITRYNSGTWFEALIRIGEGATATVTSSEPGARVFLASKRSKTDGGKDDRIYGTDGIVQTQNGVDSAHVEISNLEFNGGTMVKFSGILDDDVAPEWENDISITCKIDNVVAYAPNRPSYSIIVSMCPDVEIEVTNSKFYVQEPTYAFIHDYANDPPRGNYYRSETDLVIKDCEVICYSEASEAMGQFWYTMGAESSLYAENTKIIGNLKGVSASKSTYGPGVEIATNKDYFTGAKFTEGTKYVYGAGSAKLSLSFTRAAFTTDWSYVDATNGKYIDSVYTDTVKVDVSGAISFATFTEETIPEYVAIVDWYGADGDQTGKYSYGIVGSTPKSPISFKDAGYVGNDSSWYDVNFTWVNDVDETAAIPEGLTVVAYKAVPKLTANLKDLKANMSLSWGLVFNLYLPKADDVSDVVCNNKEAIGITESDSMYCISFVNPIDSFEQINATISYKVNGKSFSDTVTVDAIKYAELVAKKFSCGSDEAVLAYEIISYKYAVYEYVNEGAVEETVTALVDSFKETYASHADGCTCTDGLYSDDVAINAPELDESEFENLDIYYISYILDSTDTGIFIEAEKVTMVTYKNLLGELVVHSEENGNLFYDDELCGYKITGITAADITSEFNIYVDDEFVTYTLAQYIANNSDVEVAKALYSYAMAAKAYKIAD